MEFDTSIASDAEVISIQPLQVAGYSDKTKSIGIEREEIGIAGLDEMLNGGIPAHHIIALIGSAGTGKSTLALQYIYTGLKKGQGCIYICIEETEDNIIETASLFGWDLRPYLASKQLAILQLSATDIKISLERIECDLPELIKSINSKRFVIDSVTLFEILFEKPGERRQHLFDLCRIIKQSGATTILTSEISGDNPYQSKFGLVEYIADGVISLRYIRSETAHETSLAIQVIKMRHTMHSRAIKPYRITEKGINVYTESEVF